MREDADGAVVYPITVTQLAQIAAQWDKCRVYHLAALEAAVDEQDVTFGMIALTRLASMFSVN